MRSRWPMVPTSMGRARTAGCGICPPRPRAVFNDGDDAPATIQTSDPVKHAGHQSGEFIAELAIHVRFMLNMLCSESRSARSELIDSPLARVAHTAPPSVSAGRHLFSERIKTAESRSVSRNSI